MRKLILTTALLAVACGYGTPRLDRSTPTARCEPAPSTHWTPRLVTVARGTVSNEPAAHLMGYVPGKRAQYFDLCGGGQTIVYAVGTIECAGVVEVEGRVVEIRGPEASPGVRQPKLDDSYRELHIDVIGHRCLTAITAS